MSKNDKPTNKNKIPLIERIIISGVCPKDLQSIQDTLIINNDKDEKSLNALSKLKIQILEEYKSSLLKKEDNSYISNIPKYSLPFGLMPKILSTIYNKNNFDFDKKIITFSLVNNTKKKHCSSLSFYENYSYKNINILLKKSITLISYKEFYGVHKSILEKIFEILSNYYKNKINNPKLLKKVSLENNITHNINVFQEYQLLPFYFSFLLNCFDINTNNNKLIKSFFIIPLSSKTLPASKSSSLLKNSDISDIDNIKSFKENFYFKIFIDDNSPFPIKDFDLSILLEKFHIEDLIILYQSLLMEYEIILIFENFEEINIIIYSLIAILYPLKWKFPVTSFLLPETEVMLDAPFATIIGVHESFRCVVDYKIKKKFFNMESTIIYDLREKKFVMQDNSFPSLQSKLSNEIRSGLCFLKSEIYQLKNGIVRSNCNLMRLFEENEKLCLKIDYKIYFNMKIISIFFNVFMDLIKNFKNAIKYEVLNKIDINNCEPGDFFDFAKFEKEFKNEFSNTYSRFFKNFIKTLMFSNFLRSFLKYTHNKKKNIFINETLMKLSEKDMTNSRKYLRLIYATQIKNKILNYYVIKYINLNTILNNYLQKSIKNDYQSNNPTSNNTANNSNSNCNSTSISNFSQLYLKSNFVWNALDYNKIKTFPENLINSFSNNSINSTKIGDSTISDILLVGINDNLNSFREDSNDPISLKIKENDEIYNLIKGDIDNNNMTISMANSAIHHRSNSSITDNQFQQKSDFGYKDGNTLSSSKEKMILGDYGGFVSVNTYVSSKNQRNDLYTDSKLNNFVNISNDMEQVGMFYPKKNMSITQKTNHDFNNKKKINKNKNMLKPLRLNYNSLTNISPNGAMAKHAGDEDENMNMGGEA